MLRGFRSTAAIAGFLALALFAAGPVIAAGGPKITPKISLFDNYESLAAHFEKAGGAILYDPKSKSLLVNAFNYSATGGRIFYYANWEQLDFDLAWDKLAVRNRTPKVIFTIGAGTDRSRMESVDVSSAFLAPGKYAINIVYKAPVLSIYINGQLARKPIKVAHPEVMETLQFGLSASVAYLRIFNAAIVATTPEGKPPIDRPTPKAPVHPRIIPLFQTAADFQKRRLLTKGLEYDARAKTIIITGDTFALPEFRYGARWQQLEMTIDCAPGKFTGTRPPLFSIALNGGDTAGERSLLDSSLARIGLNQLKLVIENGHTLIAYLNGKPSGTPMTLLRDDPVEHLELEISAGNPMQIGDVKITADPEP